jgi:hypothetical protein
VKRQPETRTDLDGVIKAMCRAEVDCIRCGGQDPALARRIAEAGQGVNGDQPVRGAHVKVRSTAIFTSSRSADSAEALAARLRTWLGRSDSPGTKIRPARFWSRATVVYTWNDFTWNRGLFRRADYNRIRFGAIAGSNRFRADLRPGHPHAGIGLALSIHEWLAEGEDVTDVLWYAPDEDPAAGHGQHMPV